MTDVDELVKEYEDTRPAKGCFFGHRWSRWSKPFEAHGLEYLETRQKRVCLKCGRMEFEVLAIGKVHDDYNYDEFKMRG